MNSLFIKPMVYQQVQAFELNKGIFRLVSGKSTSTLDSFEV